MLPAASHRLAPTERPDTRTGPSADARPATGADRIAARLAAEGITLAFGIPGGEVLAIVDALERAGIRFVLARHENGAGFMAEGAWHVTGKPAVLVATIGPGMTNAVNVIANAHQDRVPMIFLTGCVDDATAESYTHQVIDHRAVLAPITKAQFRAAAGTEDLVVDKALGIALSPRRGPVHIDVPITIAEAAVADRPIVHSRRPAEAISGDLQEAAAMIAGARNPLVLAGLDLVSQAGAAALDQFLSATGAPLLTTYKAKGLVAETDPRVIGAVGLSPLADRIVQPLIASADLIVLAGYDPIEMRAGWRNPFPPATPVLDICAEAMPHGMHRASLTLEGDVAAMLEALADATLLRPTWTDGRARDTREAFRAAFQPKSDWGPATVFEVLRRVAPPDTRATVDSGAHRILFSQMWEAHRPGGVLQSSGFCTMGCALPLAAGAALVEQKPVLAIVGDAGLEMGLGELATLRDLHLPVVVVVLVDRCLTLIEMKQRAQGLARFGVDFGGTDFAAVTEALGGHGVTVNSRDGLTATATAAFARPGFTVIAAEIGANAYDGCF